MFDTMITGVMQKIQCGMAKAPWIWTVYRIGKKKSKGCCMGSFVLISLRKKILYLLSDNKWCIGIKNNVYLPFQIILLLFGIEDSPWRTDGNYILSELFAASGSIW